jgi:hypothetical protein
MKKINPIELLTERIDRLANQKYLFYDEIVGHDYLYIKEKIFEYCEKTNNKSEFKIVFERKISDNLNKLLGDINEVASRVRQRLPVEHPLYLLYLNNGVPIGNEEQSLILSHLISELDCCCIIIETIIGEKLELYKKKIIPEVPKAKSGRKSQIPCFKGEKKLSKDKQEKLLDFILAGREEDELFKNPSIEIRELFFKLMNADDVSVFAKSEHKIILGAENYMFAFVLTWLEKNGYMKSPFQAVEKSKFFCRDHGYPIKANALSKAKSDNNLDEYITTELDLDPPVDMPTVTENNEKYFPYLNYQLHKTFKAR